MKGPRKREASHPAYALKVPRKMELRGKFILECPYMFLGFASNPMQRLHRINI